MNEKIPCIYILASQRNGTIYTGVTNNLQRRLHEHKNSKIKGFTQKYKVHTLVYYEIGEDMGCMGEAIEREKQIKSWSRKKKLKLIEKTNPEWIDLSNDIF